jgi:N-acetylmuramoyl-L-alanine amidase CwlA
MSTVRKHLSAANVLSFLALFVALSGATYAATTASKNSVKAKSIAKGAVTAPKLRNGAVTRPKIRNGAVIGTKIAVGAVGSNQLLDGGVRSVDLGGQIVTTAKLKDGAVTAAKLAPSLNGQLVKNVSYVTKTSASNPNDSKSETVSCPSGKQVTGGGARVVGASAKVALAESAPTVNGEGKRTGWTAAAREVEAEGENWAIEAYAICAEF